MDVNEDNDAVLSKALAGLTFELKVCTYNVYFIVLLGIFRCEIVCKVFVGEVKIEL